jgi:tetratricopeptide (TPR) repeat protein
MKANSLQRKLDRVSSIFAVCAIMTVGCSAAYALPDGMGRWAPDERWTKWQEEVDRGFLAYTRRDYVLAEKLYRQALEKAKQYADNPSKVVEVMTKIISNRISMGEMERAEPSYKEMMTLATTLNKQKNLDELAALAVEELANHYYEASGVATGNIPLSEKRRKRAILAVSHCIDIRVTVFGEHHPKLVAARGVLANIYISSHQWDDAKDQLSEIKHSMKNLAENDWIHDSRYLIYLGCVYEKMGKEKHAARIFEEIQKHFNQNKIIGEIEKWRANFYRLSGEPALAEAWFRKELAAEQKHGSKFGEMNAIRGIAGTLEDRDRFAEAEKHYRQAFDWYKKNLKLDTHHKFTDVANEIERTMIKQGKIKEANQFRVENAAFIRTHNPRFKSPARLQQEELEIFNNINEMSKKTRVEEKKMYK